MQNIRQYFTNLSEKQYSQLDKLQALYSEWNDKINLVSRNDIELLYERHVLHSLAIAKYIKFKKGTKIIDVGTGGGFPGIPLAIVFPEVQFLLIDSIGKKIKVVQEVVGALNLTNVLAQQKRSNELKGEFDFVVSRAVTAFPDFVKVTSHLISKNNNNDIKNGIIYLKGGDFEEEIKPFKNTIQITDIKNYFQSEFFETKRIIYLPLTE